jgi:hypothetical protein
VLPLECGRFGCRLTLSKRTWSQIALWGDIALWTSRANLRELVFVLRSSHFSLKPRVRRAGQLLEVSTPTLLRVLTAFAFQRNVSIDLRKQTVYVFTTAAWFFSTHRRLKFEEIEHVAYSFGSVWTSWDWLRRVHDLIETFTIGLKLKDSAEVVHITSYIGQGAAGDISTWMMGDNLIDLAGTQEDDSRHFVKELCETLQTSLSPPAPPPKADSQGRTWTCAACGRAVAPRPTCLYCGGNTGPAERPNP